MHCTLRSEGIISHIRPQLLIIGIPFTGGIHRTNMADSRSQHPSTSGEELFNVRSSRHGVPPAYTAPQCLPPLGRPRTNSLQETRMLPALSPAVRVPHPSSPTHTDSTVFTAFQMHGPDPKRMPSSTHCMHHCKTQSASKLNTSNLYNAHTT